VRIDLLHVPPGSLKDRSRAARLQAAAQTLYHSLRAEDVEQAIEMYREAADVWGRCGDAYGEAIALGGEAESQFELSRYSEAGRTLDRAVNLDPKNTYLQGWIAHLRARAYLDEWESGPAARYAAETMRLGNQIHDSALITDALADLAEVEYWSGGRSRASYAKTALSSARESGMPEAVARCLLLQAYLEEVSGTLSRAFSLLTEAEEDFRVAGNPRLALESTEEFADIESRSGDVFGALTRYAKLAPLSKATGNLINYGIQIESVGDEYELLDRFATAGVYFRMADEVFSRVRFRSGESLARGKMCDTELRSLEPNDAAASSVLDRILEHCEASLEIAKQIDDPFRVAIALYRVGLVYQRMAKADGRLKRTQLARRANARAFDFFTRAARKSDSVDDVRRETRERISLGEVLEDVGKRQDARGKFELALKLSMGEKNSSGEESSVDSQDPAGVLEARYHIARWYSEDGQYGRAEEALQPALDQIEAARASVSDSLLQASYFAAERKCYELGVDLRMHQRGLDSGSDALELSERTRARSLLDALSARRPSGAAPSGDMQERLLPLKMAVDQAFDRRLRLQLTGGSQRELDGNAADLVQSLSSLDRAELEAYASANPPSQSARIMTAEELKHASARSGDTYLEYELGTAHSYLWVIDQGQFTSYALPPRDQIEGMVKKWRAFVISGRGSAGASPASRNPRRDAGKDLQQLSVELYSVLLGHVVKPHMKRLVIVPDGDLAMLPFTALPDASSLEPAVPLIAGHEVVLAPSLSIFLSRKPPTDQHEYKGEVAVVADPVFDQDDERFLSAHKEGFSPSQKRPRSDKAGQSLPRLLNTGFEAHAIEKAIGSDRVHLALGFDASLKTLLGPEMQNYRIWHLATHGLYDETTPEFSGLVFSLVASDGRPVYGVLKAQDVAHMHLQPELVVLSACDSGAGENVSGEGVMGLSYSFLRAGAKSVISTLWSVDDTNSKQLMAAFYAEMKQNGNNAADALRQSQLALMRLHRGSSFYYWAGFQLTSVGD
jgi:CHAT domain-containing protein